MRGRSAATERGVNARLTSLRILAWSAPSMDSSIAFIHSTIGPSVTPCTVSSWWLPWTSRRSASSATSGSCRSTAYPSRVRAQLPAARAARTAGPVGVNVGSSWSSTARSVPFSEAVMAAR